MGRANGRRALSHVGGRAEPRRPPVQVMMVAGQNLENHRIRVSCFPSRGFMFSLIGFVFPFQQGSLLMHGCGLPVFRIGKCTPMCIEPNEETHTPQARYDHANTQVIALLSNETMWHPQP